MRIPRSIWLSLLATAVCLLLTPLHGAASETSPRGWGSSFHGVYAGGLAGLSGFDMDLDYGGNSVDGMGATGINNAVFLGTGTVHEGVYLGFEANLVYHNADFSENIGANDIEADPKEGFGVSARAGGLLSKWVMAYALAGWQQVRIELSDNTGFSEEESFDGVRAGVGMEYQSNQNVFLRGEFSHTIYYDQTMSGGAEYEIEPQSSSFQLGIGYRF